MSLPPELVTADPRLLAAIAKEAQRQGWAGQDGQDWAAFVTAKVRENGGRVSKDPNRHPKEMLLKFVKNLFGNKSHWSVVQQFIDRLTSAWDKGQAFDQSVARLQGVQYPTTGLWHLVNLTQTHAKHKVDYKFPSDAEGWVRRPREMPDFGAPPTVLALDCEMCSTSTSSRELLSVTVVTPANEVLLQTLVQPAGEILDLKTAITGITHNDLQNVTATRLEVATRLLSLFGGNTILVGHGLHHDLRSLQLDYWPVIDTAYVYSYRQLPDYLPALARLSDVLLRQRLREEGQPHDARKDAFAAVQLALMAAQPGAQLELEPDSVKVDKDHLGRLMVHKLPKACTLQQLHAVFQPHVIVGVVGELPGDSKFEQNAVFDVAESPHDAPLLAVGESKRLGDQPRVAC